MDMVDVNVDIQNTKSEKIFHVLVISVEIRKVLLLEHYFMQVREAMKSRFIIRNNFVIRNYLLSLSPKNEYDTYRICYNK